MTYYNNKLLTVQQGFMKNNPAYSDDTLIDFGLLPISMPDDSTHFQWDHLFSSGAKVKKSDGIDFWDTAAEPSPEHSIGKRKWFGTKIELEQLPYRAFIAGSEYQAVAVGMMQQDCVFQLGEDLKTWAIGKGTDFTADPDFDADWRIFTYKPAADGNGTTELPIPFMEKVVPDGGTAGTPETTSAMGLVLRGPNQTTEFGGALIGPIIDGALQIKDAKNGRRLVKSLSASNISGDKILMHTNPRTIAAMKRTKEVQPSGDFLNISIYQSLVEQGVTIKPFDGYAFSNVTDGVCEFGIYINPGDNFFIGFPKQLEVDGFTIEQSGGKKKAVQTFVNPSATGIRPYKMVNSDGVTQYFSGYFEGSFEFYTAA